LTALDLLRLSAPAPFELWHVGLLEPAAPHQIESLSDSERARAARFVFERDRRRYLAAHCALRQVLASRTGVHAADLVFEEGPFGKPFLKDMQNLPHEHRCTFNMSHSEDVALIAMADAGLAGEIGEIGVDVEMLRPMPDAMALARQNFSASECAELAATKPDDQALAFLLGWTRKEACLKAIGSGLSIVPNIFTAGLTMQPLSVQIATPQGTAHLHVHSFRHGAEVVGSLARIEAPGR
jgi:4'-phosphopantetheinyl transferase